jgi:hypothetical protein
MNTKTILLISLLFNAGLLGSVAFLTRQIPSSTRLQGAAAWGSEPLKIREAQQGPGPHFGPEFETLLGTESELLDFETGKRLVEPSFESFGRDAKACVSWIQSNGLDVSCSPAKGEYTCLLTYYMAVVPAPAGVWDDMTAGEVLAVLELAAIKDPKRHCFLTDDDLQTFLFRTREGTVGMMRVGSAMPEDDGGVYLQYKLVVPGEREVALKRAETTVEP